MQPENIIIQITFYSQGKSHLMLQRTDTTSFAWSYKRYRDLQMYPGQEEREEERCDASLTECEDLQIYNWCFKPVSPFPLSFQAELCNDTLQSTNMEKQAFSEHFFRVKQLNVVTHWLCSHIFTLLKCNNFRLVILNLC